MAFAQSLRSSSTRPVPRVVLPSFPSPRPWRCRFPSRLSMSFSYRSRPLPPNRRRKPPPRRLRQTLRRPLRMVAILARWPCPSSQAVMTLQPVQGGPPPSSLPGDDCSIRSAGDCPCEGRTPSSTRPQRLRFQFVAQAVHSPSPPRCSTPSQVAPSLLAVQPMIATPVATPRPGDGPHSAPRPPLDHHHLLSAASRRGSGASHQDRASSRDVAPRVHLGA